MEGKRYFNCVAIINMLKGIMHACWSIIASKV